MVLGDEAASYIINSRGFNLTANPQSTLGGWRGWLRWSNRVTKTASSDSWLARVDGVFVGKPSSGVLVPIMYIGGDAKVRLAWTESWTESWRKSRHRAVTWRGDVVPAGQHYHQLPRRQYTRKDGNALPTSHQILRLICTTVRHPSYGTSCMGNTKYGHMTIHHGPCGSDMDTLIFLAFVSRMALSYVREGWKLTSMEERSTVAGGNSGERTSKDHSPKRPLTYSQRSGLR